MKTSWGCIRLKTTLMSIDDIEVLPFLGIIIEICIAYRYRKDLDKLSAFYTYVRSLRRKYELQLNKEHRWYYYREEE